MRKSVHYWLFRVGRAREYQAIRDQNPGCRFPTCFCRNGCAAKTGENPNKGRMIAPWQTGGWFGVVEQ